jgi:hypothetical protein
MHNSIATLASIYICGNGKQMGDSCAEIAHYHKKLCNFKTTLIHALVIFSKRKETL